MDRTEWAREYRRLVIAYGNKADTDQSAVYFSILDMFEAADVAAAVTDLIGISEFFPRASAIAQLCREARWEADRQRQRDWMADRNARPDMAAEREREWHERKGKRA